MPRSGADLDTDVNLLDSLLDAIVRLDGDALVMHVGEKPYVVTTSETTNEFRGPLAWGQVELSTRVLSVAALAGMLDQILPIDQRTALDEYGATEYDVTADADPAEGFTIVAARGGDDIWLEIRRQSKRLRARVAAPAGPPVTHQEEAADPPAFSLEAPVDVPAGSADVPDAPPGLELAAEDLGHVPASEQPDAHLATSHRAAEEAPGFDAAALAAIQEAIAVDPDWGDDVMTEGDLNELLRASAVAALAEESAGLSGNERASAGGPPVEQGSATVSRESTEALTGGPHVMIGDETQPAARAFEPHGPEPPAPATAQDTSSVRSDARAEAEDQAASAADEASRTLWGYPADRQDPRAEAGLEAIVSQESGADPWRGGPAATDVDAGETVDHPHLAPAVPVMAADGYGGPDGSPAAGQDEEDEHDEDEPAAPRPAAVVVPLSRPVRPGAPPDVRGSVGATLQRLLGLAAARGAATMYVVAQSAPMVRVDGEFSVLDGEPVLSAAFVERLLADLAPPAREGSAGTAAEWIVDVPEIGRVRSVTFRDHRGPGIIFRIVPPRAISADQLGLSAEVQSLCAEADGLVLVGGGRGSGRSTLLTSFVDLINRSRSDHVITVESQIEFVHENRRSLVSQREVRGDGDALVAAVRAACREEPDVLVVEDLRTPELIWLALEAAESGRLVIGTVPSVSAVSVIERVIEMFPAERREKAQASLAGVLRGVVSQVLLRKLRGGRVAAREVLLNTPVVSSLILEGKASQLPAALDSGRRQGMVPFAESLAALVRDGTVHPSHAYRKAPNREHFLAVLRRDGVDASVAERLA